MGRHVTALVVYTAVIGVRMSELLNTRRRKLIAQGIGRLG